MIGIIGAMDIEINGLAEKMENPVIEKHGIFQFVVGKYNKKDVVAVVCGIGKVSAAICTQIMIDKYYPDVIINSGVAGGLSNNLSIADIAIAKDVVQHDVDTTIFGDPAGYITNLDLVNIPVKEDIYSKLKEISGSLDDTYVECGTIATGDQFISTPYQKNKIKDTFDAIATEMEGGSVGHVCYSNNVDFGIIRAISDNASGDALMDYESFKVIAANKSIEIICRFIDEF